MSSNKGTCQEMYQPPARRSGGSFDGSTSIKNIRQGSSREMPPNCCDDDDDTIRGSPIRESSSECSFNSTSPNRRNNMASSFSREPTPELPFNEKCNMRQQFGNNRKIPKATRLVGSTRSISNSSNFGDNTGHSLLGNSSPRCDKLLDELHLADTPYIDSHCHTDFIYTALSRTYKHSDEENGIERWVDKYPKAFPKAFAGLIANFIKPDLFVDCGENNEYDFEWIMNEIQSSLYIGTTWGCHPHHAEKWGQMKRFWITLDHILSKGSKYKVLAVGECGIDLHRCESDVDVQKTVFEKHIALAYKYDLPLVIHCRNGKQGNAENICLEILREQVAKHRSSLKIHRHCYTENWPTAQEWLKQCKEVHFGYTPAIFGFSESQIEAVRRIPLDRILLETDAPYFKPKCFDGIAPIKVSLPGMALATASRIAEIKKCSLAEVLRATYNNTRRVYQIPVY